MKPAIAHALPRWRRNLAAALLGAACVATAFGLLELAALGEGALFSWLWPRKEYDEEATLALLRTASWVGIGCSIATLARPLWIAALPVAAWFAAWTAADVWGRAPYSELAPFAHAARLCAPLALILLCVGRTVPGPLRLRALRNLLAVAAASTFAVHGWEAWDGHPEFQDFLHGLARRVGTQLSSERARLALRAIGILDFAVALGALLRFRLVLAWMVLWALATAALRPFSYGLEFWPELLVRLPFAAVPAALWILSPSDPRALVLWRTSMIRSAPLLLSLVLLGAARLPAQDEPTLTVPRVEDNATFPADGLRGSQPHHWRIVWTEDPQHRALVAWDTGAAGGEHFVHYDTVTRAGEKADYAARTSATKSGRYSGDEVELYYHHALLEGLEPNTTYWFVLESDGVVSAEMHFRTAPDDDRPFSILSGGDSRSDRGVRRRSNRVVAALVEARPEILALAHGGDYVVWGTQLILWDRWLRDHELTTTKTGRVIPVIPTRGNHEAEGPNYDEVFGWPGGGLGRNYYATQLSPQVLLITLNTETAAGGDQAKFLAETLERKASVRWQLAQYHRPIWPAVKRPCTAAPHWSPLFDAHGLDVGLENDGHVLKRTVPIKEGRADESGTVYVGEGCMGVGLRTADVERWYLRAPGMGASTHHVWEVRLAADQVELLAWDLESGKICDRSVRSARVRAR